MNNAQGPNQNDRYGKIEKKNGLEIALESKIGQEN